LTAERIKNDKEIGQAPQSNLKNRKGVEPCLVIEKEKEMSETLNIQDGKNNNTANLSNPGIRDDQGRFKPGFSGNPTGRPKNSLKDYDREKFANMTPEEKDEFLKQISPELRYRMAEGNPATDNKHDITATVNFIVPSEIAEKNDINSTSCPEGDSEGQA
jgi:hypothetical protein